LANFVNIKLNILTTRSGVGQDIEHR